MRFVWKIIQLSCVLLEEILRTPVLLLSLLKLRSLASAVPLSEADWFRTQINHPSKSLNCDLVARTNLNGFGFREAVSAGGVVVAGNTRQDTESMAG